MRFEKEAHGECHLEILRYGRERGLHSPDVNQTLNSILQPPLAVGGTGATEARHQGLANPLMSQLVRLLVTDFAGDVLKIFKYHTMMMWILLPAIFQANWPVRHDEAKNSNNFLACGPKEAGKTYVILMTAFLCIPGTLKKISRLTGAGLDGGDENGFVYIMDELGKETLSAEMGTAIMNRLKQAMTDKEGGSQETQMKDQFGNYRRHSVFTKHKNMGCVIGATNYQKISKIDQALLSRFLVSMSKREGSRADKVPLRQLSQMTASEDGTSRFRAPMSDYFQVIQYLMAMLSSMISAGVVTGNYELANKTVNVLAEKMERSWGFNLGARHQAMILNNVRVYTSMKIVMAGLLNPAVRSRMLSDGEIEASDSLEKLLFILAQRSLFASQVRLLSTF